MGPCGCAPQRYEAPQIMSDRLTPTPEDKFAFGMWTIGHPGRDPFGDSTRPPISTADYVRGLADIGAWGVSFHDDDLMTFGAPESERRAELDAFKKVLDETGVVCSMLMQASVSETP